MGFLTLYISSFVQNKTIFSTLEKKKKSQTFCAFLRQHCIPGCISVLIRKQQRHCSDTLGARRPWRPGEQVQRGPCEWVRTATRSMREGATARAQRYAGCRGRGSSSRGRMFQGARHPPLVDSRSCSHPHHVEKSKKDSGAGEGGSFFVFWLDPTRTSRLPADLPLSLDISIKPFVPPAGPRQDHEALARVAQCSAWGLWFPGVKKFYLTLPSVLACLSLQLGARDRSGCSSGFGHS